MSMSLPFDESYYTPADNTKATVAAVIGTSVIIVFCVGFVFTIVLWMVTPTQIKLTQTVPIIACQDNVGVSGTFYHWHGYIQSTDYIYVMYESDIGKRVWNFKADMTGIKDSSSEKAPCVEIYDKVKGNFLYDWYFGKNVTTDHYILYIPAGSVSGGYNIDMK
jgi:hypothetical protein